MTTWSATDKSSSVLLFNDNLTALASDPSSHTGVRSTGSYSAGKIYFEIACGDAFGSGTGFGLTAGSYVPPVLGAVVYGTGDIKINDAYTGVNLGVIGSSTLCFAADLGAGLFWARRNGGDWNGSSSGDPATGAGGLSIAALFPASAAYAVAAFNEGASATVNFGASPFAYALPSGFSRWDTLTATSAGTLDATLAALTASSAAPVTPGLTTVLPASRAGAASAAVATSTTSALSEPIADIGIVGIVAGATPPTGAADVRLDAATLAATGHLAAAPTLGVLTATLGPLTLVAAGRLVFNGLAPFTFENATLTATATLSTGGVLNQTLGALTLTPPALGVEKYGELTRTLAALTLTGNGTALSAALDATLAALTLAGTGGVAKTGRLERTLAALSLAGSGALANRGTLDQTLGALTLAATNSPRTFFMAWTTEGAGFDSSMLREDESVFAFEIIHEEADFPSLRLDLKNPKVGLLAAGRNQWIWFSWRDPASGEIVPLFHGRLIGIPEDLHDEVVRLQFVARPSDYIAWKNVVAEGLKVRPFWDAIWISEGDTDPDTVLEARPAAWHIDRVSLAVTASDTIIGEDGTLAITADDHFYDALKVSYGDTPLRRVDVTGTVTWTQQGSDVVDITRQVYDQFRFAGSPYEFPMVSSFTGDGLLGDWPAAGDSIGGGWSMDATALALQATWQNAWLLSIAYVSPVLSTAQEVITPGYYQWGGGWAGAGIMGWKPAVTRDREFVSAHETIGTVFPLLPISTTFTIRWEASRARTEIVKFAITADTQPLLVDPGDDETDKIDLSSDFVGQPVDPGGALPIGSLLRNSYFNTDRGNQSVEYLIMLARAKMLARARAVSLSVETPFGFASRLSCRMNATVQDPRLPGGAGTGKVTRYALSVDGDSGEAKAEIVIGCTIGRGNSVTADPGEPTYGEPDWADGYQTVDGATLDAGTHDILYESFDGLDVVDDDGLDLFRMTPDRVIQALTVWDGPDTQQNTLNSFYRAYTPPGVEVLPPEMGVPVGTYTAPETPTEMLSKIPTVVDLQLVPIGNQSFETTWEPSVSALMVPKTIDLEADYV